MLVCKKILIFCAFACCGTLFAQNIQNPVLPGVADAGVMKYNGKYYIGGVFTNGDFYVSDDLVHWGKPVHVVTMDNGWSKGSGAGNEQIHANDMFCLNGDFHLYWSVNYWGKDKHAVHIVHAQSKNVLGPYIEPDKKTWMDNRIDPKVFKDDDGQLYMYMVRFTDGNTIWGRKMKNPAEFAGEPVCLFASLPDTWETMDNRVAEGPWVMKYRDRYYLMYNANHTSTEWGNYQLGVAEADSPLSFQNGNKYSYPVVNSNQILLEENYVDLLRYGITYEPLFDYTENNPGVGWMLPVYQASDWKKGECGFSSKEIKGSTTRHLGTWWTSPSLWLRKSFFVGKQVGNLALRVAHDGDTKIYLNGTLIYEKQGRDYCMVNLDEKQRELLKKGENLLAVETNKGRAQFFDVSLFDMRSETADDILMTPGQPNILRGPNGFEWWLIYMANKNNECRGQYINRVHFFNKTLFVEGITGPCTDGYHPEPSLPTFSMKGETPSFGVLQQVKPSTTYMFETAVKTDGDAGIIAWWKDVDNNAYIGFDTKNHNWYLRTIINGKEKGSPDKSGGKFFNSIENLHLCTMNNQGLLALAQLILPSEILSNFEVVRVEEEASLIRIYLDESVKAEYKENPEIESKGFCEAVTIRDFPIRDKGVDLIVRRRKWYDKQNNRYFSDSYDLKAEETRYSKEFAAFLKGVYGDDSYDLPFA